MERWRFEAHCHAASGFVIHCYHSEDAEVEEQVVACFDAWKVWETRLASLDAALDVVCSKHGVSAADVRRMVNADGPHQILGPGEVDPDLVASMAETFDGVLERAQ